MDVIPCGSREASIALNNSREFRGGEQLLTGGAYVGWCLQVCQNNSNLLRVEGGIYDVDLPLILYDFSQ